MKDITRNEAISRLREALLKMSDDEHSVCEVAAQKGIFCKGFAQFSDKELFAKYKWIVKKLKIRTRAELEKYANLWLVTREAVTGKEMACDVQCEEHDMCQGWDEFDNEELARFVDEVCAEKVHVVARSENENQVVHHF